MGQCAIYILKLLIDDLSTSLIVKLPDCFNECSCGLWIYSRKTIDFSLENILNIFHQNCHMFQFVRVEDSKMLNTLIFLHSHNKRVPSAPNI